MMQAIEAIPKAEAFKKKDVRAEEPKKSDAPCSKWNNCDSKGKCSYEVENPSKTCYKPHICSYCYTKFGHTKTNHKEPQCKKKEDDSATPASERLPTS